MIHPQDIVPVSEVQAKLPQLIRRARETGRPIVVTQRGRATAALLDIREYERLAQAAEHADLWEDIRRAHEGDEKNDWIDWGEAKQRLSTRNP